LIIRCGNEALIWDGLLRGKSLRRRVAIEGMYDAVQSTVDQIGGVKGVRCMDFWVAVFGA
jgi:hypothetical protein